MAVTKIRRISSWTLIATFVLSLAVFALFYFGGLDAPIGEWKNPTYTSELLMWSYLLLGICSVSMILFGLTQFALKFKTNAKSSIMGLGVIIGFVLLLFITYSIGDVTPLPNINSDSQKFNVDSWLKITDMWIYTMYILIGLAAVAMVWGAVKKAISK
jgi:hypothetical protein